MESISVAFPLLLILIIILSIIFRKGNKRLFWLLVLLFLIASSSTLRVVGVMFIYSLPKEAVVNGINYPYLPLINGIVILLLSIPLIFLCRKNILPPTEEPPSKRWLWLSTGVSILCIAAAVFVISIYYPSVIGSEAPNPNVGVITYLLLSAAGCFLLYYASRFNSSTQPNLMRWLVFACVIFFSFFITLSFMLILIFAMPPHGRIIYPFMAGLLSLSITLFSLVAVGIAKDYVPRIKNEIKSV